MLEDYRHPDIYLSSGYPLEIDFFFPNLNLAFEYQVKKNKEQFPNLEGSSTLSKCEYVSVTIRRK